MAIYKLGVIYPRLERHTTVKRVQAVIPKCFSSFTCCWGSSWKQE